jgi:hypothetical protein
MAERAYSKKPSQDKPLRAILRALREHPFVGEPVLAFLNADLEKGETRIGGTKKHYGAWERLLKDIASLQRHSITGILERRAVAKFVQPSQPGGSVKLHTWEPEVEEWQLFELARYYDPQAQSLDNLRPSDKLLLDISIWQWLKIEQTTQTGTTLEVSQEAGIVTMKAATELQCQLTATLKELILTIPEAASSVVRETVRRIV